MLLSHHREHPEGAGVRASLRALQQLTGARQGASVKLENQEDVKPFLRLAFRNHAFILNVVMVLGQELQGREKLLVNGECCQGKYYCKCLHQVSISVSIY